MAEPPKGAQGGSSGNGRAHEAAFIRDIVKDPANVPDVMRLYGYAGASSEEGHDRLYLSPDLSSYVEVPRDAILHRMPMEDDPHGAVTLWVRQDAELKQKAGPAAAALAHYFAGALAAQAAGGGGGAGGMQAAMPIPLTILPAACPVTPACSLPQAFCGGRTPALPCITPHFGCPPPTPACPTPGCTHPPQCPPPTPACPTPGCTQPPACGGSPVPHCPPPSPPVYCHPSVACPSLQFAFCPRTLPDICGLRTPELLCKPTLPQPCPLPQAQMGMGMAPDAFGFQNTVHGCGVATHPPHCPNLQDPMMGGGVGASIGCPTQHPCRQSIVILCPPHVSLQIPCGSHAPYCLVTVPDVYCPPRITIHVGCPSVYTYCTPPLTLPVHCGGPSIAIYCPPVSPYCTPGNSIACGNSVACGGGGFGGGGGVM